MLRQLKTESQWKDSNSQILLTASYSKCIIWGHSIMTSPQNDQTLTPPLHLFVLVWF